MGAILRREGACTGPRRPALAGLGALGVFLAGPIGAAADEPWLRFMAAADIEFEDEFVFSASDEAAEVNDALATVEASVALLTPGGSGLHAAAVLEPVTDPESDRYFEDFGIFLEEVYLALRRPAGGLRIGKFNPVFGMASDVAPGLYGDELAGDYELAERLGLAVDVPFAAAGGEHVLHGAVYVADRSPLSGSLLTARERLRQRDGGVSNTARPGSFALAVLGQFGETDYSIGLRHQEAGAGDDADEWGGVAGLAHETTMAGLDTLLFGEAAHFPRFDGGRSPASFLTLGAETGFGETAGALALGLREHDGSTDWLATVSLERALSEAVTLSGGYRYLDEEGVTSHTLGVTLSYELSLP